MTKAEQRDQRRLAAILSADMVGFSRLMEADEAATIARQKSYLATLIGPTVEAHRGRIVKLMGDGMLAEFASVVEAVGCAVALQREMATLEAEIPAETRIEYRVGVNLGDIIIDGDDILGDGVNVAARLQAMADPGGVCISDVVHQSIEGKLDLAFEDLGQRTFKNIARPIHVWQWRPTGGAATAGRAGAEDVEQTIRFCVAPDGVQIAYATVGEGPPLVKAPNWMNHLEYDWQSPIWSHLLRALAKDRTLVRFDQRTNGLSDWDVDDLSFDAFVSDLETVVDTIGLDRFPLLGISQGCAMSVAYAVRNPGRVSRLILYGGFTRGSYKRGSPEDKERAKALVSLIRLGWGQNNPAFRQTFTTLFIPGASHEQMNWFNELQRMTISAENAARTRATVNNIDVTDMLGAIDVPTLVLHCRDDGISPFDEGRRLAAMIPGARFVPLEGQNHLILESEPAWPRFLEEVRQFLAEDA